jgi:fructose-1,6-bisphosphatase/inositol monophosphatase family enzyme
MDVNTLLQPLKQLHEIIREKVVADCERLAIESLISIAREEEGDTIYAIDRVSEELLLEFFEREIAPASSLVLIAEGLTGGKITLPKGTREQDATYKVIVDPIDGTRGLMYQKRSAWILTGVASNRGAETSLADVELAIQTEIPLVKQHLSDVFWAIRGEGALGERFDRLTGQRTPIKLQPSRAESPTVTRRFHVSFRERAKSLRQLMKRSFTPPSVHRRRGKPIVLKINMLRPAANSTN